MPRKPSQTTIDAAKAANAMTGQDVVTAILAEDPALAQRAANAGIATLSAPEPGDTRQTVALVDDNASLLGDIYQFLMGYEPNRNAFLYALMNRIGMTIITSRMWNSPLAWTLRGQLEFGESVEEIFANLVKVQSFDPTQAPARTFERNVPDVRAAFHVMNWQKDYPVTITTDQLRQAFLSWQGIVDLVQGIITSVYKSLQKDMFETTKFMLAKLILAGDMHSVVCEDITASDTKVAALTDLVEKERATALDMTILSPNWTMANVYNAVERTNDLYFIIPNAVIAAQGVNVLASAFNMSEAEFMGRVIGIDGFDKLDYTRLDMLFEGKDGYEHISGTDLTNLQKCVGIVCGPEFFQIWRNFEQMTDNYTGAGLYWNYWHHAWYTFSVSPFEVAALFQYAGGDITAVSVVPATANISQGATLTLGATVTGTGIFKKTVTFSISGQTKAGTQVVGNQLTIAADEPATTQITVKATAEDGTSGTATITVVAA